MKNSSHCYNYSPGVLLSLSLRRTRYSYSKHFVTSAYSLRYLRPPATLVVTNSSASSLRHLHLPVTLVVTNSFASSLRDLPVTSAYSLRRSACNISLSLSTMFYLYLPGKRLPPLLFLLMRMKV